MTVLLDLGGTFQHHAPVIPEKRRHSAKFKGKPTTRYAE
jgi:hypothetical protein